MKNSSKLDKILNEVAEMRATGGGVTVDQAKQQIKDLFLEIIGEDNYTNVPDKKAQTIIKIENDLKTELRERVEDL